MVKTGDIDGDGLHDHMFITREATGTAKFASTRIIVYYHDGRRAMDLDLGHPGHPSSVPWTFWDLTGDGREELIGLRGSHPFFSLEIGGFVEGIKGDYADGWSLFLIRFGEEDECRKNFVRLKEEYAKIPGYEEHEDFDAIQAEDSRGRRFFVSTRENYLFDRHRKDRPCNC